MERNVIIGTAGHIDHGKTTLIKALTGRDTDRLKEEKERGITIDLGFTYFDLPDGRRAGIIDVPGHERFIKNMLAGVSGFDIVLLVVAANEGVMPQTKEHLDILNLLMVKKGIIVVTKIDLVDKEWLSLVIEEIREAVKDTFLRDAPIIPVSSLTGEGLDELKNTIAKITNEVEARELDTAFRLNIDRVFVISGFGTVVTGTLISGIIEEGQKVEIYPSNIITRVRGIQVHEKSVKKAFAGQRVALNLANVKKDEIRRGDVIAPPGWYTPSFMLDVKIYLIKDSPVPIKNLDRIRLYIGTKEVLGRAVILDREDVFSGEEAYVQLRLEEKVVSERGDRFIVRTYSPMYTIGGGIVIEPNPPKRKRFDNDVIEELKNKERDNLADIILQVLNENPFLDKKALIKVLNLSSTKIEQELQKLLSEGKIYAIGTGEEIYFLTYKRFNELIAKIKETLQDYRKEFYLKKGIPKEELRSKIFGNLKTKVFEEFLQFLKENNIIDIEKNLIFEKDFKIVLEEKYMRKLEEIEKLFYEKGLKPPKIEEVLSQVGLNEKEKTMYLDYLTEECILVKISDEIFIHREHYYKALKELQEYIIKNGNITVSEYRDLLGVSRKYALALLEFFDRERITVRNGDVRILRSDFDDREKDSHF